MKKIIVNSNCIGCGACTSFCDVFKFNDEGLATADENKNIIDNMDEETKENAMDALENCPVSAIEIIDEELATTDENKNIIDNIDKKNAMNMVENFNNKNDEKEEK